MSILSLLWGLGCCGALVGWFRVEVFFAFVLQMMVSLQSNEGGFSLGEVASERTQNIDQLVKAASFTWDTPGQWMSRRFGIKLAV